MEKDRPLMKEQLENFIKNDSENFLVLYPEGTFTTPQNLWQLEKSQKWSEKCGQKVLKNLLSPRTTGFELVMETSGAFDYVVDCTIAFESPYDVNLGKHKLPVVMDFFRYNEEEPVNIHIHFRKYAMNEVSKDSAKWLLDRWEEKEDLLDYFKKNQKFPGTGFLYRDSVWDHVLNYLLQTFIQIYSGYSLWYYFPKTFYVASIFCLLSLAFFIWYDYEHQKNKFRPSKSDK